MIGVLAAVLIATYFRGYPKVFVCGILTFLFCFESLLYFFGSDALRQLFQILDPTHSFRHTWHDLTQDGEIEYKPANDYDILRRDLNENDG